MRLSEYLRKNAITQSEFAARLNPPVTQSLVSQWILGASRVTLERAIEIERLTRGEVSPAELAQMHAVTA